MIFNFSLCVSLGISLCISLLMSSTIGASKITLDNNLNNNLDIKYLNILSLPLKNNQIPMFSDLYLYQNLTTNKNEFISISDRGNSYKKKIDIKKKFFPKIYTLDDNFNLISIIDLQLPDYHFSIFNIDTINPEGIIKINNTLCIILDEYLSSLTYVDCQSGNIIKRYLSKTSASINFGQNFIQPISYPIYEYLPYQSNLRFNKGMEAISYDRNNNILYYMFQSIPSNTKKILFVRIDLEKDYSIIQDNINTFDYLTKLSDYRKLDNNIKLDKIKIKISSMTFYLNDIYVAETYKNILIIYKLDMKKNKINKIKKKIFFSYVFPKEEKIEGLVIDEQYIYLGIDTDFLPFEYNLIKIKYT